MSSLSLLDLSPGPALAIAAILFAAGMTKGVMGIGLPIIAVPLLSMVVPVPTAVAVLGIPILLTNVAQSLSGEPILAVLQQLLPLLAGMTVGVLIGVALLTELSLGLLQPLVGVALIIVAILMIVAPKFRCPDRAAPVVGPLVGIAGGILGGVSGQGGPLAFIYLLSRGVTGDRFVQYSSIYLVTTWLVLMAALGRAGTFNWTIIGISLLCAVPILLGMRFGTSIRGRVPDRLFRGLALAIVILSGLDLCGPWLAADGARASQFIR